MKNTPLFLLALLFFGSMMSLRAIPMERNKPETKRLDQSLRRDHERAATGESSAAGAEAVSLAPESAELPSGHIGEAFAGASDEAASEPTSTTALLNYFQKLQLGPLVTSILISDPKKQIEKYVAQYRNVLQERGSLNPGRADEVDHEVLPKTEREWIAFYPKLEEVRGTNALEDGELMPDFNGYSIKLYGLKAVLNVLDIAKEHRNRFLQALHEAKAPEVIVEGREDCVVFQMSRFYHQQINNVDKTIQNLQKAAASILEAAESINTRDQSWSMTHRGDVDERIVTCFREAQGHALDSMFRNTQYAEEVRVGNPEAARDFTQWAVDHALQSKLFSSAMEYGVLCHQAQQHEDSRLVELYARAQDNFWYAARAEGRGRGEAPFYNKVATYYSKAAQARIDQNQDLAGRLENAGLSSSHAAKLIGTRDEEAANLYIVAASYDRNAAQATIDENEPLATGWDKAGSALFNAVFAREEKNENVAALYLVAATDYRNAVEAKIAGDEPLTEQWTNEGDRAFEAAGEMDFENR